MEKWWCILQNDMEIITRENVYGWNMLKLFEGGGFLQRFTPEFGDLMNFGSMNCVAQYLFKSPWLNVWFKIRHSKKVNGVIQPQTTTIAKLNVKSFTSLPVYSLSKSNAFAVQMSSLCCPFRFETFKFKGTGIPAKHNPPPLVPWHYTNQAHPTSKKLVIF